MLRRILLAGLLLLIASCSTDKGDPDVCFVGDSIFSLWDIDASFPDYTANKYAVIGAKLEDLDGWHLSSCKDLPIVFLLGTNNIGYSYQDTAIWVTDQEAHVQKLLKRVDTLGAKPLLYVSILPRNANHVEGISVNQYIEGLNDRVRAALDSAGIDYRYIDAYTSFLDGDYTINDSLFTDGLHPSAKGYEVLTARVAPFL